MKVTDDMVYRLGQCLVERAYDPYGGGTDDDLRYALEQALANERDGEWYMANLKQALDEDLAERVELQKRLVLAEAKLEAVRKVADDLEQYAADMFSSCGWENADGQSVISETAQAAADDIRKVLAQ